nr:phage tail spike protein [Paenibacillus xylanexedens]
MPNPTMKVFDKNIRRVGTLVDSSDIQRRRRINSDYEVTFMVPMTSDDYREKIAIKGHVQDERGQFYVIQSRSRSREGRKLMASIYCNHIMFKLNDFKFPYTSYIDEAYGVHLNELTDLITKATGGRFTFAIHDTFDLHDVKDFGRGTCLEALNRIVEMYECEVEPDNFVINLKKRIGSDHGLQYRLKKNIVSSSFKDKGESLVTRMYAQMKDGRTFIGMDASLLTDLERILLSSIPGTIVNGKLAVNYLVSPFAQYWASDSVPFYDGEIIEQDIEEAEDLLKATRKALLEQEVVSLEATISTADLFKIDHTEPKPHLGDDVMCIDPDMGMNRLKARITELTEYPYSLDKHAEPTISNINLRDYDDIISDLERNKNITNNLFSNGKIRTDVFESFAKQAVIDINNSKTELIYPPEGGILAQEKTNPLEQVRFTSKGLGISTDGWKTIRAAITAGGIVAEQVIGQLGNFVSMLIGNREDIVQINTNGIAAGASSFNSAPFRLNMKGDLIANSLTANYANIEYSNFKNGAIVGSSINVGNGMFTVTSGGIMSAVGANFSGSITASTVTGTNINGGTITGALIRTAASGRRIEQDSVGFRSYDAGNRVRIQIATTDDAAAAAIIWRDADGTSVGEINSYSNSGVLTMYGNSIIIGSNNTGNPIRLQGATTFGGAVIFSNSNILGLNISNISGLQAQLTSLQSQISSLSSIFNFHTHNVTTSNHNHGNSANLPGTGGGTFTTTSP